MPPQNRRTAFDVSFPEEAGGSSTTLTPGPGQHRSNSTPSVARGVELERNKRKHSSLGNKNAAAFQVPVSPKRPRIDPERLKGDRPPGKFNGALRSEYLRESANMVIVGEDRDERSNSDEKPVRLLSNFEIFNPRRGLEHISLSRLESRDGSDHHFEAAGCVSPVYTNEEDAGQEDGMEDEEAMRSSPQRLRTSAIFRHSIDYTQMNDPLYIETTFAWYILNSPADSYQEIHDAFYRPHRCAQIVISAAIEGSLTHYGDFKDFYLGREDPLLDDCVTEDDLCQALPLLKALLDEDSTLRRKVTSCGFVREIFALPPQSASPYPQVRIPLTLTGHRAQHPRMKPGGFIGNPDVAVLRPENQTRTHVTPHIDGLALGLFSERLKVVGSQQKQPKAHELKQRRKKVRAWLLELLTRALAVVDRNIISFPSSGCIGDEFWSTVNINGESYEVGDCIVVQAGAYRNRPAPEMPGDLQDVPNYASIADYFWIAKIIYINQQRKSLHVQYFEHASTTYLQEISNPHELFLCQLCGEINLLEMRVLGKVVVHQNLALDKESEIDPLDFFCRFMYNDTDGSFTDIDGEAAGHPLSPPDNCTTCLIDAQRTRELDCVLLEDGFSYLGSTYHTDDYVLFRSKTGPGQIGRISQITPKRGFEPPMLTVQLLGRMVDAIPAFPPAMSKHMFADERELFLTNEYLDVGAKDVLRRCVVLHTSAVEDLPSWLQSSPQHFHVKYLFPSLQPQWPARTELPRRKIPACVSCSRDDDLYLRRRKAFSAQNPPLRTFDPFAGVGAFGLAMEETGCLKVTHAVEISPSAANTLKKNSPSTQVLNQCANVVLEYAIKLHANKVVERPPRDLQGKALPLPPKPGQIDCIITGFPCQPHSSLNMFQRADDRKSHLMLNLLSWIDHLKPKYCIFENVKGFLSYKLHASQASRYRVEGGVEMGGLKFLVHALLTLGYQVRFGLLQAGHYGTPQGRVRFFLVAAQKTYYLPFLPQPTHNSIVTEALEIKFPNGVTIAPILTGKGTALFKHTSIADAISDLVDFDWENPRVLYKSVPQPLRRVPTVKCNLDKPNCGPTTLGDYSSPPKNSYQKWCRRRPTEDIQHFTNVWKAEVIERVVNVPLKASADYRDLPPALWQWHTANPASAMSRLGFPPGFFSRLDKDKWFHTTVTNVAPTAKQGYVVHPWCHRVVTVRELARSQGFPDWFVFAAHDDNVKTMQRQIGNAVPWQVGEALGREVWMAMFKKWEKGREDAIDIT